MVSLLKLYCLDLASSSPGGDHFQLSWVPTGAVSCVVFTIRCAGTQRLLPFLMILAPVWLFLLQICVWLSKLIHGPPVSPCSLVWPPASHQGRTVSQVFGRSPQDAGLGDYLWHPFRRMPRKPTAPQGAGGSVPPLPVLSPACVNEGNWFIFQSVSPEGSLLVHTPSADLVTNFTTAVQCCGDFRPSYPNSVEYTRHPMGNYFGYPAVAQPGCSVSAGQQATIYLPIKTGLCYDSNLPYSPTS